MFAHMGVTFGAKKLQCEEGKKIVQSRDTFRFREIGHPHNLVKVELGYERGKEKHPGPG